MYGIYDGGKIVAKFVTPLTIKSNEPVFASDTLSLKRHVAKRGIQRWELEAQLEPLSYNAQDLFVNIVTKGYYEPMTIITPQNYGVITSRTSTSTPTGVGAAGASVISVSGNSGKIPKGTFIKFNSYTKVYMTTSDLTGNGTVGVYPKLRSAINSTFQHRDDVIMTCYYDIDTVSGMRYQDGILMDLGTFKLVEAL